MAVETKTNKMSDADKSALWGAGIQAAGSIGGALLQGKSTENTQRIADRESQKNRFLQQQQAQGGSLSKETLPFLNQNIEDLFNAYQERGPFIADAGSNVILDQAFANAQQGTDTSQLEGALGDMRNAYDTGKFDVTAGGTLDFARNMVNSPFVANQTQMMNADINRGLGSRQDNTNQYDQLTGNQGSSQGGIFNQILNRGDQFRDDNFKAGMVGNALDQAHSAQISNAVTQQGALGQRMGLANQQIGMQGDSLQNLLTAGELQRDLDQSRIQNQIGARDWNLENVLQYGDALQGQAQMGNYIGRPGEAPLSQQHINSLYSGVR